MIEFYITEQSIRFASPVIAANALDYLEAKFHFSGNDWDGCSKWAHFRQGETVYDLNLEDDAISAKMHLNLSVGRWEVYVTGNRGESRLTTVPVILTVRESGLVDEPLHLIPQTVAEQVDNKAELALQKAAALEEAAESGRFDGKSFHVRGYFKSFEELEEKVREYEAGDSYCVGTEPPYSLYIYDGIGERWVDNGTVIGMKGDRGPRGTTFTPRLSESGNLSWINDGGRENPPTVNIMGPKGDKGETGAPGKSPYELAAQEGFLGTEETFNWSLANIAAHGKGHEEGGSDPIRVTRAMIADGAVSAGKLAANAVKLHYADTEVPVSAFKADESYEDFPYRAAVALEGALASMAPEVMLDVKDAVDGSIAPVAKSYDGGIYLYAAEIPENALTIPTILLWRTSAETYTGLSQVTVSAIPVAYSDNSAGGKTVTIG